MLDVLCASGPTWKLRSPSAPPCERTFTTCSSPLELPAAILGALARPNNIGHDPAGLSMNWPTLLIPRIVFERPRLGCCAGRKRIYRPLAPPRPSNLL